MTDTAATEAFFAWLTSMRETDPVHEDENGAWHLFSYQDVRATSSTWTTPTSRHARPRGEGVHPRLVDALEPRIAAVTNDLLDAAEGTGTFDLVDALSHPLPIIVIADLLGVPGEDQPTFRRWAEVLLGDAAASDSPTIPDEQAIAAIFDTMIPAMNEMNAYLLDQIRQRRQRPTDDLIGLLVAAETDGQRLTDAEIVGFAATLLLAGHVTTTATLGNSVYSFLEHPEVVAELRADPALLVGAIDEVLRYRSPFPRLGRVTKVDVEIGGRTIPAGKLVLPWLASANRDPEKFADPDRFDIHRDTSGFVTFGHGIHFCVGARLARLEARVALSILLSRYAKFDGAPDADVVLRNPYAMLGVARLPLVVG